MPAPRAPQAEALDLPELDKSDETDEVDVGSFELSLIAELIERRGIAGMREAISNTAELGATVGGPRIVDEGVRARMAEVLGEVRAGKFAAALRTEESAGYPLLAQARARARKLAVEAARERLLKLGS